MPEDQENRLYERATCAFCRIIRREEEASVVFEDDLSLAFLDHQPLFPGHCLLVPKAHYETLADLPAPLVGLLFQNAQLLERAIEEGLGADGTFVAINNRISPTEWLRLSVSHSAEEARVDRASGTIRWGMCKPVSERFALPRKNSQVLRGPNNKEKDVRMNASSETWQLGNQSIQVTHLEKVYWPQSGFTQGDVLHYYQQVAPVALPYLKGRPVTLRVYPQGVEGASCYLRDCPEEAPNWLRRVNYQPKTVSHAVPLPVIDTVAGLLWFANQGAIEFHLWGSHLPDLNQPDLAIFDLDPGETASFDAVREAALRLHDALTQAGVRGYPKTSGGGGLHVFVPLAPGHIFERVRTWVKEIGEQLESTYPDLIALARGATHRGGRVTVDYAQNSLGRNTATPYTLRAPSSPDGLHPTHLGGTGGWHPPSR